MAAGPVCILVMAVAQKGSVLARVRDMVVLFLSGWVDTVDGMRNVMWGTAVALLLGAAGCTSGTPAYLPSGDESPEAAIPVVATTAEASPSSSPSVVMIRGLDGEPKPRASAETIAPDESIMATMECEPLSEETARYGREVQERVAPFDPVQVLIGEGLTPNEMWWVVAYERLGQATVDGSTAVNQAYITTQPGVDGQGQWVNISSAYQLPDGSVGSEWNNVRWDHDRLLRGQSALRKALDCLDAG